MTSSFLRNWILALAIGTVAVPAFADDFTVEEGFTSLFNGKDLSGWEYGPVPVTKKPIIEKLADKTASTDGCSRFVMEKSWPTASG